MKTAIYEPHIVTTNQKPRIDTQKIEQNLSLTLKQGTNYKGTEQERI